MTKEDINDEIIKDLESGMSVRAIGRKHDIPEATLRYRLKQAGLHKPKENKEEIITGTSTLTDEAGNTKLKWTKTKVKDTDNLDSFKEAITHFLTDNSIITREKISKPLATDYETLSVYTIGDAHIGMLAWDKETGEDYDLDIAQKDLLKAMDLLTEQSHQSERALIIDVGDWFHSDNAQNRTAHSGNVLDVDGRYPKVLQIGLNLTTKLIDRALMKHERVEWRSAIGNHNEHSAIMMTAFIKAWYRNEARVIVHDTPNMFFYRQFGKNLIGVTHGHTAKAEKLGEIMSVDCKDLWSGTEHRYWYTGHIHHQSVKEFSNCVVETFRTLAGKDAWHSASGYRSGRDMKCITLHKDFGEISRNTVSLSMVRHNG
jgi:transposase-like protein